jgi:Schlafen, AlbA_2
MDQLLIENLLNQDESSSLDFKRDQYAFDGADDNQKSELIKDVLAFANAWRQSDAYILIGVDDVQGGRSIPVGVTAHLKEANIQQLINSKVNRPIEFRYEAARADGQSIGVIQIPIQTRPFFLNNDYGKLKKDVVYLRRGSATDTANPDEIVRMVHASQTPVPNPKLTLIGRIEHGDRGPRILVSLKNEEGAGLARAPHLAFKSFLGKPFQPSQWGLDGKGMTGLPKIPEPPGAVQSVFEGDTNVLIHAGTERRVTYIDYVGDPVKRPGIFQMEYELAADGLAPFTNILSMPFP